MEYFYKYATADTLNQYIFYFDFDFISTWNQGVFLWSFCIYYVYGVYRKVVNIK